MQGLKDHKNLTTFKQHGFVYKGESGTQVYGYSVFSGKDNFWINPETKMWDCKNSGESGGFQQFLRRVHEMSKEHFKGTKLGWLKSKRSLMRSTLKHHNIGYNPHNDTYLIPVYDGKNDTIWDLRIYNPRNKKVMATAGCTTGLYGWDSLQSCKNVWLVEGEWDKMAMWEILQKNNKLDTDTVVAVPGANTFKSDWCQMFKDKNVFVVYDDDEPKTVNGTLRPGAGPTGEVKVYKSLKSVVKSIKFVHWDSDSIDIEKRKDGYDVNDFLIECRLNHKKVYNSLIGSLQPEPYIDEKFISEIVEENKTDDELFTGKFIPAVEVYAEYRKWLYIPDTDVIDAIFGTIIANRMSGDPIWLFVVAPSGATKTEFCMSVSEAAKIVSVTTMTPHSLVSGANYAGGGDPSLIPRLNGKVLIIKDFTTILNMNSTARDEIFGLLRDAYDGKIEKMFGNGVFRSYESKFGIIAGVTPVIELYTQGNTAFGERFLSYKIPVSSSHKERLKYLKRAMSNVNKEDGMRQGLRDFSNKVLSYNYTKNSIQIPEKIEEKLMTLAEWTATMRGTVERDVYSKEILADPFIELATRLVKQYTKFLSGITLFRGKKAPTRNEYCIVRDLAVSSVASDLNKITRLLYKSGKDFWVSYKDILQTTELPSENLRRKLENLVMLKVIHKRKEDSFGMQYSINHEIFDLIKDSNAY